MPQPAFDTSFEGGNIQVTLVDPPTWTFTSHPSSRERRRTAPVLLPDVKPLAGAATNMIFQDVDFFTRPYYSYDNMTGRVPARREHVLGQPSPGPGLDRPLDPLHTSHEQQLIDDVQGPYVQTSVLATSEGSRPVHRLTHHGAGRSTGKHGSGSSLASTPGRPRIVDRRRSGPLAGVPDPQAIRCGRRRS